jgi:predicted nucleotidyltransferase
VGVLVDLSHPAEAVVPSLDGDVLAVLARTTLPLTGRAVASLSLRGSQSGVHAVLTRLVRHGLVHVSGAGSANLYLLNRDHVAAVAVLALVDLRGQLYERITDAMRSWDCPPLAAAVFGSAARGDGDNESDIDLFLVRPAQMSSDAAQRWEMDVAELAQAVRRWSGNPAGIVDVTPEGVQQMLLAETPVTQSLRRDAVTLLGTHVLKVARPRR